MRIVILVLLLAGTVHADGLYLTLGIGGVFESSELYGSCEVERGGTTVGSCGDTTERNGQAHGLVMAGYRRGYLDLGLMHLSSVETSKDKGINAGFIALTFD